MFFTSIIFIDTYSIPINCTTLCSTEIQLGNGIISLVNIDKNTGYVCLRVGRIFPERTDRFYSEN